jgi:hypothetical protein
MDRKAEGGLSMNKRMRKKRGIAKITEEECWNLDYTLAKFIIPRLYKFKQVNKNSYPIGFDGVEDWHKTIDKMIKAFELQIGSSIHQNEERKIINKGLHLFATYFNDLWD